MPTTIATTSKATARKELSWRVGDWLNGTTTAAGSTTTAVDSAWIGVQADYFRGRYLLMTAGAASGQWRRITDFTSSSGTFTLDRALSAASGNANTYEVHVLRPDWFTLGVNQARLQGYPTVYRPITSFLARAEQRDQYNVPRNMRDLTAVLYGGSRKEKDLFDRGNTSGGPGGNWTQTTGTWVVTSERLLSSTDANGDLVTQDLDMPDGFIKKLVRGTLNSAVDYRAPALVFRIAEDNTGAIDANNYLLARLLNGVVDLRKVDNGGGGAGVESSLTTATTTTSDATDYVLAVLFTGTRIRVWVDEQELISYELVGPNFKFVNYPRVGIRWDKGGAPATAARVDDYWAYKVANMTRYDDWRQSPDRQMVQLSALGNSALGLGYLVQLEGRAVLSALAEDTTYGTLASDSAAALEIATTDPAWELLMAWSAHYLYNAAAQSGFPADMEQATLYQQQAGAWLQRATALAAQGRMPQVSGRIRHP